MQQPQKINLFNLIVNNFAIMKERLLLKLDGETGILITHTHTHAITYTNTQTDVLLHR